MTAPDPAAPGVDAPSHDGEPVGSVAEEAYKLFRAVTSPAAPASDDAAASAGTSEPSGHVCSTAWCPVCQVVGFVRDHPESLASVARSATDLARSLRDLVDVALSPEGTMPTSSQEKQ